MVMMVNLIKIRFFQIAREMNDIGLFRAIMVLLIILPFLLIFLYQRLQIAHYSYYITGLALLLVYMIHRRRKDYHFLFKISESPALTYYTEYLVLSIPLLILYVVTRQYLHLIIYVLLIAPISFTIPMLKLKSEYSALIRYIPSGLFEWQSGFRKYMIPIILFYALGLAGIYNIWFSAVSVFLLMMIICSFYAEYEPLKLLEAQELDASAFIKTKIISHVKYLIIFVLPIFMLSFIHYEFSIYIVASFLVVINLQIGAILLKYAYYYPNIVSGAHQMIISIILLCSVILPVSILFLFLNMLLFYKARRNLNDYLHAYN